MKRRITDWTELVADFVLAITDTFGVREEFQDAATRFDEWWMRTLENDD